MYRLLIVVLILLAGCQQPLANRDSPGTTVVCFGDSLTEGVGADPGRDYPAQLQARLPIPVINAGVRGNTTADALARLDKDVLSHDPKLVIITLGGNDFLQSVPESQILANMTQIIERIKNQKAMVVWAEVKTSIFGDAYLHDFQVLAAKEQILLIPDILHGIIDEPRYKYDQIHPNSDGYKIMADRIYDKIKGLIS